MDDGIARAMGGMMLQSTRTEATARNIAGANMSGFKRDLILSDSFRSKYYNELGSLLTGDLQGTQQGVTVVDFSPGTMKKTDRTLDFALENRSDYVEDGSKKGQQVFFQVRLQDGSTAYTKNGSFFLNNDKELVTAEGYPVLSNAGQPIALAVDDNPDHMTVMSDGLVRIEDKSTFPTTMRQIGTIGISSVKSPERLKRLSANYFSDSNGGAGVTAADENQYNVMNCYVESSNSNPITDMVDMIQSMRAFEMNSKVIKTLQERFSQEQNKLGAR